MLIRVLGPEDVLGYRELRLRALQEHPEAFASSYARENERPLTDFAERLTSAPERVTWGALEQDQLLGMATIVRSANPKQWHRATLTSMYLIPHARRRGLGRALLDRVLATAAEWGVSNVALAVTVVNGSARQLYVSAGFTTYGVEPRSLCVNGRFYDVELMNLQLQ